MLAEAILQLRIYALYSLNKRLLAVMMILYLACSACSAWIIITYVPSIAMNSPIFQDITALPVTDGNSCLPQLLPLGIFEYWIPMLSYDSLLCVLVLFQGFRRFRSNSSIFLSGKRLVNILIRDSVIYFLVIFVTYLTCLLIWAFARRSFILVPVGFSFTMSCIMANRVVLNSRKISRNVSCTVTGKSRRMPVMFVTDDDGVPILTKDVGGRKEVLSVSEVDSGERPPSELGLPTLDFQWP